MRISEFENENFGILTPQSAFANPHWEAEFSNDQ
jgi:hypothetical protein